jgi:D-lactate dehydrogenase (cytochrome)
VLIVPFGAGTSLEGHVNAPQSGVSIDVRNMNQVRRCTPRISIA